MQNKYKSHVEPKLELIKGWAREGATDKEIAAKLGVAYSTFNDYKLKHSELSESLKESKEVADFAVENALYKNAIGGNITAQIFWLKNRKPKQWREKVETVQESQEDKLDSLVKAIREAAKT